MNVLFRSIFKSHHNITALAFLDSSQMLESLNAAGSHGMIFARPGQVGGTGLRRTLTPLLCSE